MKITQISPQSLTRFAWLSIAAAVITIGMKASAYLLTGSVGLLSDALESVVNLAAAIVALGALTLASQPPDEDHEYGHDKVEYFSSGVEGALILVAAFSIAYTSAERLVNPQPLEQVGIGLMISLAASLVNLAVARVLMRAGREHYSVTLEADAQHLMTDVWTSAGVMVSVVLVAITHWNWLDPAIGLAVAFNILVAGARLLRRSYNGLMDTAIKPEEREAVEAIFDTFREQGIQFHALRTRQSGARRFISVHVLVPGMWTVSRGHYLLEDLERSIRAALPNVVIGTHLEPLGDPTSMADIPLQRTDGGGVGDDVVDKGSEKK